MVIDIDIIARLICGGGGAQEINLSLKEGGHQLYLRLS